MGIESDQVVFAYLSRVGDVAQQRQLPSATRMRLVSDLRNEIDRHRARTTVDSPAAVRRILDRLGTPDDIVEAAGGDGTHRAPVPPPTAVPEQRDPGPGRGGRTGVPKPPDAATDPPRHTGPSGGGGRRKGVWRSAPGAPAKSGEGERRTGLWRSALRAPGESDGAERRKGPRRSAPAPAPAADPGASSPHRAGAAEPGDSAVPPQPDWWRVDEGPFAGVTLADGVPGFVGGVEIPDLLKPPPRPKEEAEKEPPVEVVEETAEPPSGERFRRLPRLWPEGGWNNPLLLVAAVLLVVGAVAGQLVPLGLGWLIAYLSRRLTPAQRRLAVLGLPGAVAAGAVVWLWGRTEGRWGAPIAEGRMSAAVTETWPWTLRAAAVATALYLLWHTRRPRG